MGTIGGSVSSSYSRLKDEVRGGALVVDRFVYHPVPGRMPGAVPRDGDSQRRSGRDRSGAGAPGPRAPAGVQAQLAGAAVASLAVSLFLVWSPRGPGLPRQTSWLRPTLALGGCLALFKQGSAAVLSRRRTTRLAGFQSRIPSSLLGHPSRAIGTSPSGAAQEILVGLLSRPFRPEQSGGVAGRVPGWGRVRAKRRTRPVRTGGFGDGAPSDQAPFARRRGIRIGPVGVCPGERSGLV